MLGIEGGKGLGATGHVCLAGASTPLATAMLKVFQLISATSMVEERLMVSTVAPHTYPHSWFAR
jgi:hypothetical protein